jgi:hypothetical protein
MLRGFATVLLAALGGLAAPCKIPAHAAPPVQQVDLELVLAVDASSSVDIGEYGLQLRGIAASFRDPDILGAIKSGPQGRIAVNVLIWGQQGYAKLSTGWIVVSSMEEAEAFAKHVEKLPRRQFGGTAIGEAMAEALASFENNGFDADRRIIDVSGDGRETLENGSKAILLPEARKRAQDMNVVVNGLAVLDGDASLLSYYEANVRSGPGSFVIAADKYTDFADALRLKLFREIAGWKTASSVQGQH